MDNRRLMEELHHEHMGRDGDPVRDLPGDAPVVYGGAQLSDFDALAAEDSSSTTRNGGQTSKPAGAPLWLAIFMLAVCVGGGFAVGYAVGAWMGVGG